MSVPPTRDLLAQVSPSTSQAQSNQQQHRKEELQYLLGRIRQAITTQLGPKLLRFARTAEQATSAAHESLTVIMRMISWQLDHSQVPYPRTLPV